MQWAGEEKEVIYLTKPKPNYPWQTYFHISAPTNLQYQSRWLMKEIITSIKIWKNGNKDKYTEKSIRFFTIWNLKGAVA